MSQNKSKKNAIIAAAILLVLVIGAIIVYFVCGQPMVDRHPGQTAEATAAPEKAGEAAPAREQEAAAPSEAEADTVTIVVSVTYKDGSEKEFTIVTDALNLRGALEQEDLIQGDESEYGLYVTAVDGEAADAGNQEWWCFNKGGEMLMTGVDDTLIADGDHYEIVFTVGW
ncbi:MAG: DUF4430 domain-containing protein [Oscillospiraceae bacterium]|nr:DUF4430 domain-containing protein [Oscillospiraceae bacterium]